MYNRMTIVNLALSYRKVAKRVDLRVLIPRGHIFFLLLCLCGIMGITKLIVVIISPYSKSNHHPVQFKLT